MESQETLLFNHMLPVNICPAIPKPWQVEHEINNKIGVMCFANFLPSLCCNVTLQPLNSGIEAILHV